MRCLFCEVNPGTSHEHTWPDWMIRYWDWIAKKRGQRPKLGHVVREGENILRTFEGKYTTSGFCTPCNTGWMSDMENTVKPVLLPMMEGRTTPLAQDAQRVLAKWALLKSLVFAQATPEMPPLPKSLYRQFFRKGVRSVSVHVMGAAQEWPGGTLTIMPLYKRPSPLINSFQSVFHIGYAVIHVLGHPVRWDHGPFFVAEGQENYFFRIWPTQSRTYAWPPYAKVSREFLEVLATSTVPGGIKRPRDPLPRKDFL
jgi:hypothetical protein